MENEILVNTIQWSLVSCLIFFNTSDFDKDCLNLSIKGLQIHFLKDIKYAWFISLLTLFPNLIYLVTIRNEIYYFLRIVRYHLKTSHYYFMVMVDYCFLSNVWHKFMYPHSVGLLKLWCIEFWKMCWHLLHYKWSLSCSYVFTKILRKTK